VTISRCSPGRPLACMLALAEAGELALSYFRREPRCWRKSDGTPVSEADIAVDDLLRSATRRSLSRLRLDLGGKLRF
jgi:fructose-1,6-bisphosphatase/inositol monophosphatase family enzyme